MTAGLQRHPKIDCRRGHTRKPTGNKVFMQVHLPARQQLMNLSKQDGHADLEARQEDTKRKNSCRLHIYTTKASEPFHASQSSVSDYEIKQSPSNMQKHTVTTKEHSNRNNATNGVNRKYKQHHRSSTGHFARLHVPSFTSFTLPCRQNYTIHQNFLPSAAPRTG